MLSRREFLSVGVATTGGLLISARSVSDVSVQNPYLATQESTNFGIYLEISPSGVIFITCPQSEMGQGIHDGLPKILAEELGASWADVQVRLPYADDAFINPSTKRHRTANSESTMVYFDVMRNVGSSAREMLITVASQRWDVPLLECKVENSKVIHDKSKQYFSFAELAEAAGQLPIPSLPRFKEIDQYKLVGKSTLRKDTPSKVDGSAIFGIDIQLPGMLYAALRRSPAVVSKLISYPRDVALSKPGVVDAIVISDGLAIIARSSWQARLAAESLEVQFDDAAALQVSTPTMRRAMLDGLDLDSSALIGKPAFGGSPYDKAATLSAITSAYTKHEWIYEVPFLAHAALEPLCATVVVHKDYCEAWAPSQQPDRARDMLAKVTGLPTTKCRLNITFLGGGFGRKWETDFIKQAAEIASAHKGVPIKLTWTREQDFLHDRYRPAHLVRTRVGLDASGSILGMHTRTTGVSMWKYQGRPSLPNLADPFVVGLLINDKYNFPNKLVDYVETPAPIPVGTWRSVSQSMNGFFSESAIDDIAAVTHQDPLDLRLHLCSKDERAVNLLHIVREKSGWSKKLPKGRGRGIAITFGYDSYCAQVIEVSSKGKQIKIQRIVAVFDCGLVIDPKNVEAQVEGGIVWGLSAAMSGQINFLNGAAVETNFHTSPIIRLSETPPIEVHILHTKHKPGGAGEASVPAVAPALASAIFYATGNRPRRLPLTESGYEFV